MPWAIHPCMIKSTPLKTYLKNVQWSRSFSPCQKEIQFTDCCSIALAATLPVLNTRHICDSVRTRTRVHILIAWQNSSSVHTQLLSLMSAVTNPACPSGGQAALIRPWNSHKADIYRER